MPHDVLYLIFRRPSPLRKFDESADFEALVVDECLNEDWSSLRWSCRRNVRAVGVSDFLLVRVGVLELLICGFRGIVAICDVERNNKMGYSLLNNYFFFF